MTGSPPIRGANQVPRQLLGPSKSERQKALFNERVVVAQIQDSDRLSFPAVKKA